MSDKQQTARKFLRYIKRFFQKAMAPALDARPGHPLIDPHAVSPYPRQRHDTFVIRFDGRALHSGTHSLEIRSRTFVPE